MVTLIKVQGKDYVRVGDKLIEVDHLDEAGKPVFKCFSEETPNENGGQDVTIHLECLQIQIEPNKL